MDPSPQHVLLELSGACNSKVKWLLQVLLTFICLQLASGNLEAICNDDEEIDPQSPECLDDCRGRRFFLDRDGICKMCVQCQPGYEHDKECGNGENGDAICIECPEDHYSYNLYDCVACRVCENTLITQECSVSTDRQCGECLPGFYKDPQNPDLCNQRCEWLRNPDTIPACKAWLADQQVTTLSAGIGLHVSLTSSFSGIIDERTLRETTIIIIILVLVIVVIGGSVIPVYLCCKHYKYKSSKPNKVLLDIEGGNCREHPDPGDSFPENGDDDAGGASEAAHALPLSTGSQQDGTGGDVTKRVGATSMTTQGASEAAHALPLSTGSQQDGTSGDVTKRVGATPMTTQGASEAAHALPLSTGSQQDGAGGDVTERVGATPMTQGASEADHALPLSTGSQQDGTGGDVTERVGETAMTQGASEAAHALPLSTGSQQGGTGGDVTKRVGATPMTQGASEAAHALPLSTGSQQDGTGGDVTKRVGATPMTQGASEAAHALPLSTGSQQDGTGGDVTKRVGATPMTQGASEAAHALPLSTGSQQDCTGGDVTKRVGATPMTQGASEVVKILPLANGPEQEDDCGSIEINEGEDKDPDKTVMDIFDSTNGIYLPNVLSSMTNSLEEGGRDNENSFVPDVRAERSESGDKVVHGVSENESSADTYYPYFNSHSGKFENGRIEISDDLHTPGMRNEAQTLRSTESGISLKDNEHMPRCLDSEGALANEGVVGDDEHDGEQDSGTEEPDESQKLLPDAPLRSRESTVISQVEDECMPYGQDSEGAGRFEGRARDEQEGEQDGNKEEPDEHHRLLPNAQVEDLDEGAAGGKDGEWRGSAEEEPSKPKERKKKDGPCTTNTLPLPSCNCNKSNVTLHIGHVTNLVLQDQINTYNNGGHPPS